MAVVVNVNRQWRAVTEPAFSHGFNLEKIKGIKPGTVSTRTEYIDIEEGDGEYDLPVFRTRRTVEFGGYVVADSAQELNRMGDRHAGLLAGGDLGRLTVEDEGERRWMRVRLHGTPEFEPTYKARADFGLELRAPDPRMFGKPESITAPVVSVVNRGNFRSTPKITISGSGTNDYAVYGPGGRLWRVTRDLVAGHPHTLDFDNLALLVDGVEVTDGLTEADPFACPPNKATTITFDANGNTATMNVTHYPTWI